MKRVQPVGGRDESKDLLLLLAEEMKQPLVSIMQLAEVHGVGAGIDIVARQALSTIDSIVLYQRVACGQQSLRLEPVHIGTALRNVEESLGGLLQATGCRTHVSMQHALEPVDADHELLLAAIKSLWQGFMSFVPHDSIIFFQARRTSRGICVSIKSKEALLDSVRLTRANFRSTQPVTAMAGTSADILVAQSIFSLLGADLKKVSAQENSGFSVTLPRSKQLELW